MPTIKIHEWESGDPRDLDIDDIEIWSHFESTEEGSLRVGSIVRLHSNNRERVKTRETVWEIMGRVAKERTAYQKSKIFQIDQGRQHYRRHLQMSKRAGEIYQPSNGTEGMDFESVYCDWCLKDRPDSQGYGGCEIHLRALCHDLDEKEYPKEWIYDSEGLPTCTAFEPDYYPKLQEEKTLDESEATLLALMEIDPSKEEDES